MSEREQRESKARASGRPGGGGISHLSASGGEGGRNMQGEGKMSESKQVTIGNLIGKWIYLNERGLAILAGEDWHSGDRERYEIAVTAYRENASMVNAHYVALDRLDWHICEHCKGDPDCEDQARLKREQAIRIEGERRRERAAIALQDMIGEHFILRAAGEHDNESDWIEKIVIEHCESGDKYTLFADHIDPVYDIGIGIDCESGESNESEV